MSAIAPVLPLTDVVRRGAEPVRQGEPCRGVWVVQTGILRSTRVSVDGRRLADLLGPGDAVGGPDGTYSPDTVRALRASRLRAAGPHEVPTLLERRRARAMALAQELAWLDVSERIERRLHEIAERFGGAAEPRGVRLRLRLTQDELADLVGCTRESANRAIRRLSREGGLIALGTGRYVLSAAAPCRPTSPLPLGG